MVSKKDMIFRIDSIMDISQINKALTQVQKGLSGLKLPQNLNNDIKNVISSLTQELDEFRQLTEKDLTSMKDIKNVTSSYEKIVNYYKKLGEYTKKIDNKDLKDLIPDSAIQNIEKATKALKEYETQVEDTQKSINNLNKEIDKQKKALKGSSEKRDKLAAENRTLGGQKGSTREQIQNTEKQLKVLYERQKEAKKGSVEYKQLGNQIKELETKLTKLNKAYNDATIAINKNKVSISGYDEEIKQTNSTISSLTRESEKLKATGIDKPFEDLKQKIAEIKGVDISEIPDDFNKLKIIIDSLTSEELDKIRTQVEQIKNNSNEASPAIRNLGKALDSVAAEANELNRINREIENLSSQVEYYFGIENTIELFKRGIRQAYQSVKELDKAMTDTAVVTDFSVGDMWDALPRYTEAANKLGTTTLGAYETMTLFYQQGLKTNEVFEIGTETMKMARIANMDYTKATNLMTAALRGFNMELNEVSAKRINDVYSELAAITAADTEEIADAMTRTASIANSAGMEFETTSAFLSQMIETTREAPENLGTAMKTIIARFQELKKAPSEIASEIDGEAVNVNKIDAALKSIGVSLMDNVTGQFRELDDVFLEISSKWNSLDKNTQRYIATVAAGSRQQSRFIAMMNNYERTMELVDAANNSAGASQRQFEKTTESLESKLNKAKNAWNEFTRNLANSTVIKGAVDLFTKLINILNKLLNTMPSGISMIVALVASLKTLGATRKVIQALITTFAELISVSGTSTKVSFLDNLITQFTKTGKKASVVKTILENFKSTLGKKGVAGTAAKAGPALQVVGTEASSMGASFAASGSSILAVVAAIGAVIAIGYSLWSTTQETERELKRVSEAANDAANHTNTLKDSISKLSEKQQEMIEIDSSFDNLIEGTNEWNSKLIESNSLISEIIAQFPEMAQYLKTIDGRMQFDEAGWNEINKRFEKRLQVASNLQASLTAKQGTLSAKAAIENTDLAFGPDTLLYGFSEESKIKYSKYFAENPQYLGLSNDELRLQMQEDGMDVESITIMNGLIESADELATAFNNYTIASDSENAVIKSLLESNLNIIGVTGSAAAAAANIASKSYKPEEINPFLWLGNAANEEQTRTWAEKMGYRLDDFSGWGQGVKYTDLSTGEKGEISNEEVLVQFNELEAQEKATKVAEEIANSLIIDNEVFAENFKDSIKDANLSDAFSGLLNGDTLVDKDLISTIVGDPESLSTAIDNMLNGLSDDEKAERIANYLGEDIETVKQNIPIYIDKLTEEIRKSVKNINKIQKQRDNKLRGMVGKGLYNFTPTNIEKKELSNIENYINSLEEVQKQFLVEIGDKLTANLGEEALKPFLANMKDIYNSDNEALIQEVTEYINDIDFSNPIQATRKLKLGINSDIEALSNMSRGLLKTGKSSLDAAAQFQYLYQQESFSDITEEIDKMVLEEGKIDGAGVLELTSKSSDLRDMIDNTGISVKTLGQTFTALSKGKIALTDLNSGVMEALTSFNQLNGIVEETSDFISKLDLGIDAGKLSENLHSTAEEIIGMYEAGEYGNPQIENFIKQFFGEDRWNEALTKAKGNLRVAASQFINDIRLIGDNLYNVWASFNEEEQKRLNEYNDEAGTEIQISQLENGEIQLDIGKASTEEVIQGIMRAYQVTEEYANLILTDFMNNSADLRSELIENDWTAGLQNYLKNNKLTTYEDGKEVEESYINAKDVTTLFEVTGKDEIEYWKALAEELGIVTDNFKTVDDLKTKISESHTIIDIDVNNLEEVKKFFGEKYTIHFDEETAAKELAQFADGAVLDLDKVQKNLNSMHIPQDVIDKLKTEMASIWGEKNKYNKVKLESVELSATEVAEDIQSATEKAAKQADFSAMGEVIAKALSKEFEELNPEYKSDNFIKKNKEVTDDLKNKTSTAISDGTSKGIRKATKEWNNWNLSDKSVSVNIKPISISAKKEGTDKKGLSKKETALVGEIGPELVENQDGTATLYGVNGPTIANLNKGAVVHTAKETKKILKGNNNLKTINRYAIGYGKSKSEETDNEKNKKGSSNKDSLPNYAEPLDYLYNLIKKINKELRLRNKYEKEYERYLNDNSKNAIDLSENIKKQYENYQKIISDSEKALNSRSNKISTLLNQRVDYRTTNKNGEEVEKTSKYKLSRYIQYDKKAQKVEIDWDRLEKLRLSDVQANRDLYSEIINYLQTIEGYEGDIEGYEDNIEEATDSLVELEKLGHDAFVEFENRVYEAIVKREQEKIDKLSQINTSINDSNQDLLDTIQSNLSKIRQERDNQETEDDIAAKERRLAYLRRDTSNANQLEIKQLEEELEQQKQDYTDTLIDQKISELQEQNDFAANQRQQQIDLLQAQLDYDSENGKFWAETHELINKYTDEITGLVHGSELEQLLQSADGFKGMSEQQQMDWFDNTDRTIKEMWDFMQRNKNTALEDKNTLLYDVTSGAVNYGDKITATQKKTGEKINGYVNSDKNLSTQQGTNDKQWFEYDSDKVYRDEDGNYITDQDKRNARRFKPGTIINIRAKKKSSSDEIVIVKAKAGDDGLLRYGDTVYTDLSVTTNQKPNHYYTKKAQEIQEKKKGNTIKFAAYKTGGIADFTGPAWLDGTKSKPEMVLNQKDTQNFIQLKDILRGLFNQQGNYNNVKGGDNYYEIQINVDKLENDYDVDKVAEKVKKIIVTDSKYRNVNSINRLR